ncbi:MAG: hypothetical protein D6790_09610, partial [Caldilineae bacterium]
MKQIKWLGLGLSMLVAALLMAGCWQGLIHTDPDEPIVVEAGQSFALSLPGDPEGVRTWKLVEPPDPNVAALTTESDVRRMYFNLSQSEKNEEFWVFHTIAPGETTITLERVNGNTQEVEERRTYQV